MRYEFEGLIFRGVIFGSFKKRNFGKKGVIVVIGVLLNLKVKYDLLRKKKSFFLMQEVTFHFLFDASHRRAI